MTKICTKCKVEKSFDDFTFRSQSKDKKHSHCKECIKKSMQVLYRKNPQKKHEQIKEVKRKISEIVNKIKSDSGCKFCQEKEPICLDFHHLDKNSKTDEVARLVAKKSLKKVLEEIKKCIVVCANCHRKIHAGLITQVR